MIRRKFSLSYHDTCLKCPNVSFGGKMECSRLHIQTYPSSTSSPTPFLFKTLRGKKLKIICVYSEDAEAVLAAQDEINASTFAADDAISDAIW